MTTITFTPEQLLVLQRWAERNRSEWGREIRALHKKKRTSRSKIANADKWLTFWEDMQKVVGEVPDDPDDVDPMEETLGTAEEIAAIEDADQLELLS